MKNKIITVEEAAKGMISIIKTHAKELPEKEREQFTKQCLDWLSGKLFQRVSK